MLAGSFEVARSARCNGEASDFDLSSYDSSADASAAWETDKGILGEQRNLHSTYIRRSRCSQNATAHLLPAIHFRINDRARANGR